jgi:hypothetical protein
VFWFYMLYDNSVCDHGKKGFFSFFFNEEHLTLCFMPIEFDFPLFVIK